MRTVSLSEDIQDKKMRSRQREHVPAQGTACAKAPGLLCGGGWGEPLLSHGSVFSSRSCGLSDQLV